MKSSFKFSLYFNACAAARRFFFFNKGVVLTKTSSGRRMVNETKKIFRPFTTRELKVEKLQCRQFYGY